MIFNSEYAINFCAPKLLARSKEGSQKKVEEEGRRKGQGEGNTTQTEGNKKKLKGKGDEKGKGEKREKKEGQTWSLHPLIRNPTMGRALKISSKGSEYRMMPLLIL